MAEEQEQEQSNEQEPNTGSGDSHEVSRDEKYAMFGGKYQIVVENDAGKKLTMQHPFTTVQEAEEEVGKIHQRHPFHEVWYDDKLIMKWRRLDVYKRKEVYPYSCDFSYSYYSEENPL